MAGEFQEYPKMLYHDKRAPRVVKDKDEETAVLSQGYKLEAPAQFPEENAGVDPTREPASDGEEGFEEPAPAAPKPAPVKRVGK